MAEVILFQLAGKILSALTPHVINQIGLPWYAKKQLVKLRDKITTITDVLIDAQKQQNTKQVVKRWLQRLKDILYEADDLFDEVATEALRRDIVINKKTTRKVRRFFTRSNPILFNYSLGTKIKDIRERLNEICTDMKDFAFVVQASEKPVIKSNERTTSFMNTQKILGRDNDKRALMRLLLSSLVEDVHIIPIRGMGGIGKTTLAQMIYNDNAIRSQFDKNIWVCVSNDFNKERILTEILTASGQNVMNYGMQQLHDCFQTNLSGKKFFLVLDDVWNDDPVEWEKLKDLLMTGAHGSRILVTTRDIKVAKVVRTMETYELKGLSEEDCVSVLVNWAFDKGDETKHPYLIKIGREIVKKCDGVPLAARTLGVLLNGKTNQREWLVLRDSEMWALVQNENSILPILKLSYDQMSCYLKECFGYCSLFQKHEIIHKENLIYHWVAHGLIQSSDMNEDLEDVCETYLEELLRRSFLELTDLPPFYEIGFPDPEYHVCYKMHDLVHDLAQYVVGGESVTVKGEICSATSHRVRHVSCGDSLTVPKDLIKKNNLRTIMAKTSRITPPITLDIRITVDEAISSSRRLRVVDYESIDYGEMYQISDLPKAITKLKHLRYLCYRGARTIPQSLCKLLNLQFLDLMYSIFLELPADIGNLRKLRVLMFSSQLHSLPKSIQCLTSLRKLKIYGCPNLQSLGTCLGCLTSLQHLKIYGCPITCLPEGMRHLDALSHLEISMCSKLELCDSDFQGLTSLKYLILSRLELKQLPIGLTDAAATLKHLALYGCGRLTLTEEVLPNLHSLELFYLSNCGSITSLPRGMRNLDKLSHLEISNCQGLQFSNSVFQGLTSLEYLHINYIDGLKQLPTGLLDGASTLRHLRLACCDFLSLTEELLPNLHSLELLVIRSCERITCLPEGMQGLAKLNQLELIGCSSEFGERCRPGGEDWPKIAHVPHVIIDLESFSFT